MKTALKALVLSAAVAATALVPLADAQARDWHRGHYSHRSHRSHGDGLALGVLGLAAGAVIGGAIASSPSRRVYDVEPVQPRVYYPARPAYRSVRPVYAAGSLRPWSRSWYSYCENTYRSFNPSTGTFRGYDGLDHFCVAR